MYTKTFTKEDEHILQIYCKKLPIIQTQTHEVHLLTGKELQEMGYVEHEGQVIDPEKTYRYNAPVLLAANHYRRLKRAWMRNGQVGIENYLREVKKAVDLHKQQTAEHV